MTFLLMRKQMGGFLRRSMFLMVLALLLTSLPFEAKSRLQASSDIESQKHIDLVNSIKKRFNESKKRFNEGKNFLGELDFYTALRRFEEADYIMPDNALYLRYIAIVNDKQGNNQTAITYYKKLSSVLSKMPTTTDLEKNEIEVAIKNAQKRLDDNVLFLRHAAVNNDNQGDYRKAIFYYKKLLLELGKEPNTKDSDINKINNLVDNAQKKLDEQDRRWYPSTSQKLFDWFNNNSGLGIWISIFLFVLSSRLKWLVNFLKRRFGEKQSETSITDEGVDSEEKDDDECGLGAEKKLWVEQAWKKFTHWLLKYVGLTQWILVIFALFALFQVDKS